MWCQFRLSEFQKPAGTEGGDTDNCSNNKCNCDSLLTANRISFSVVLCIRRCISIHLTRREIKQIQCKEMYCVREKYSENKSPKAIDIYIKAIFFVDSIWCRLYTYIQTHFYLVFLCKKNNTRVLLLWLIFNILLQSPAFL